MKPKPIQTINDVIDTLELIIQTTEKEEDTLGYFAILYQKVTIKVKEGIESDFFEDGKRMELLDIVFAERYIDAYYSWKNNIPVTESWQKAFIMAENERLLVIQHLLLEMNAHINLDLGVAATQISTPDNINNLDSDFRKINEILSSLVDEVQNNLTSVWPFLRKILSLTGRVDNFIVDWSMEIARKGAWKFATTLVQCPENEMLDQIAIRDKKVAEVSKLITEPALWIRFFLWLIRLGESGSVVEKMKKLKG